MKVLFSPGIHRAYDRAPEAIKRAFDKQIRHLLQDMRHPSLRAKKYDEARDVWQARVNDDWRFYFRISGETYEILSLIPHPK